MENQAAGLFFIYRFLLSLQEGRLAHARQAVDLLIFQFTPLREGRPATSWLKPGCWRTFHARGATPLLYQLLQADILFQFTPLREGRPASRTSADLA